MLIWINGAFGAGKTQTAHELKRRLRRARVADPEVLGLALHKLLPPHARGDFQDLPQWRAGVLATLLQAQASFNGPLIVPMTIVRDDYFDEIIGGLRSRGLEVLHYSLIASPATLQRRLRQRSGYVLARMKGRHETWAMQRIDCCVAALATDRYAVQIPTDDRPVDDVVEAIASDAGLELIKARYSRPRYQARRLAVGLRHIRL